MIWNFLVILILYVNTVRINFYFKQSFTSLRIYMNEIVCLYYILTRDVIKKFRTVDFLLALFNSCKKLNTDFSRIQIIKHAIQKTSIIAYMNNMKQRLNFQFNISNFK